MLLPIIAYGHPILRKKTTAVSEDYPNLKNLIEDMFHTMGNSSGVGLAAPQIGLSISMFVVDASPFSDNPKLSEKDQRSFKEFKKVFINPEIKEESGKVWTYNEGCLSIPGVHEDVSRHSDIIIDYQDEEFKPHRVFIGGIIARVIQHEYDHLKGILFTDKISGLKRRLIHSKMQKICKGKVDVDYDMSFFKS